MRRFLHFHLFLPHCPPSVRGRRSTMTSVHKAARATVAIYTPDHGATNRNSNKPTTGHLRRQQPNKRQRAQPGRSTTNPTPNKLSTRRPRQQQPNTVGQAHMGCTRINPTPNTTSTRRPEQQQPNGPNTGQPQHNKANTKQAVCKAATTTTAGPASAGRSATKPTPKTRTMNRELQTANNHKWVESTTLPATDHTQAGQYQTNNACKG